MTFELEVTLLIHTLNGFETYIISQFYVFDFFLMSISVSDDDPCVTFVNNSLKICLQE